MAKDTKERILTAALEMFTRIFSGMMEKGLIRRDGPEMMAFACLTPVTVRSCITDQPAGTSKEVRKKCSPRI